MSQHPPGAGSSSFHLIDVKELFLEMGIKKGDVFLDFGCGTGNYSVAASEYVGSNGKVYAVDLWKEGIETLKQTIIAKKINTITPIVADMGRKLPLENDSVDLCLMATVFHDLLRSQAHEAALMEIRRLLKRDGRLVLVEFKKTDSPPGPPIHIRISAQDLAKTLDTYGFRQRVTREIGPHNYLSIFSREEETEAP